MTTYAPEQAGYGTTGRATEGLYEKGTTTMGAGGYGRVILNIKSGAPC